MSKTFPRQTQENKKMINIEDQKVIHPASIILDFL